MLAWVPLNWRATAQILGTPCLACDRLFTGVVVNSRAKGTAGDPARCLCVQPPSAAIAYNSMEPKPTSPIFMLKFLIIWSVAIRDYHFYVIRSTFNP